MVERVIERARRVAGVDEVVLATTVLPEDDPLAEHVARALGAGVVRGPVEDVLARYVAAAAGARAEAVVRITADCPLLSPEVSGRVVARFLEAAGALDHASNVVRRTWPRGLDTEVLSREALERAHREAVEPPDREHVTRYVYRHPERFRTGSVEGERDLSAHRWTVDTPEDLALAERLYDELGARGCFEVDDVLAALARHPDWAELNRGVAQKAE
jgi:spore coat polysaccharide biosynthesis protein SpsF